MMASIFLDLLSIQNDYDQKEAGVHVLWYTLRRLVYNVTRPFTCEDEGEDKVVDSDMNWV